MEEELERDMTPKLIKELGLRKFTENSKGYRFGVYECAYCGREFEGRIASPRRSCGCRKGNIHHGVASNKFYKTGVGIIGRCTNTKDIAYKNYGGRGITVCEEWLDVRNFIIWAEETHPNIEGVSLDRIDNDKGYSPENCRWATKTEQNINQRMKKNNTSGYVGVNYHDTGIAKWTASIGVNHKLVYIGSFLTKEEAVQARDNYILENKLPHKLSTEY